MIGWSRAIHTLESKDLFTKTVFQKSLLQNIQLIYVSGKCKLSAALKCFVDCWIPCGSSVTVTSNVIGSSLLERETFEPDPPNSESGRFGGRRTYVSLQFARAPLMWHRDNRIFHGRISCLCCWCHIQASTSAFPCLGVGYGKLCVEKRNGWQAGNGELLSVVRQGSRLLNCVMLVDTLFTLKHHHKFHSVY